MVVSPHGAPPRPISCRRSTKLRRSRSKAFPGPFSRAGAGARAGGAPLNANPLLSDKLLDAKVRLHRRLIEEINLSALEKLPEQEIRQHIQQLVSQYILVERLALNTQELNDFVSRFSTR